MSLPEWSGDSTYLNGYWNKANTRRSTTIWKCASMVTPYCALPDSSFTKTDPRTNGELFSVGNSTLFKDFSFRSQIPILTMLIRASIAASPTLRANIFPPEVERRAAPTYVLRGTADILTHYATGC